MAWEVQDDQVPFKKQYVSIVIILLNVVMFVLQLLDDNFLLEWAFVPAEFFAGQKLWTIFTSMFMHGGPTHIFFNMLFFYVVADDCESSLGHWYFLFTYLVSGVVGTLLHAIFALFAPASMTIPTLGASGAIAGLIAVYGLLFPRRRLRVLLGYFFIRLSARRYVLYFAVMQLALGFLLWNTSATAYFAHLGGLVAGAACAMLFKAAQIEPQPTQYSGWQ
ncbi:MAG: rhomboid family intramembrane serine protease [Candidatus Thorarchaeota archaeon]|nr:rhomboid family intramembrane serine protease [Candidatus Thorarchaeota archaeon]